MAGRLIDAGHEVAIYDRDEAQMALLAERGARRADGLAGACADRQVVITMLPSDEVLDLVATGPGGLAESLPRGAIHMVSGTHGVTVVEKLAAAHKAGGQVLVSCTVLGRPDRAAAGKLGLIASGPAAAVETIRPLLAVLGDTIFEAGEDPLSGVAAKIANNFVLGCAIEAMGEGMALVRKYGVDPQLFFDVMTSGLFDCVAYRAYGDVIAKQDWGRVGATATIGLKDAALAFEAADRAVVPLPSGAVWRDHLLSACDRGEGGLDWSVMARQQFRESGLE